MTTPDPDDEEATPLPFIEDLPLPEAVKVLENIFGPGSVIVLDTPEAAEEFFSQWTVVPDPPLH